MEDLSFFAEYVNAIIVGICLCVGFIVKKYIKDVDNKHIPTICAILGLFLAVWMKKWTITPVIILQGLFSGLSATGLHQFFKNYIERKDMINDND